MWPYLLTTVVTHKDHYALLALTLSFIIINIYKTICCFVAFHLCFPFDHFRPPLVEQVLKFGEKKADTWLFLWNMRHFDDHQSIRSFTFPWFHDRKRSFPAECPSMDLLGCGRNGIFVPSSGQNTSRFSISCLTYFSYVFQPMPIPLRVILHPSVFNNSKRWCHMCRCHLSLGILTE